MATKKEMIAELVALGVEESEIKDLKNAELEAMLQKIKSENDAEQVEEVVEETKETEPVETKAADKSAEQEEKKVVRETSMQLGIFRDYIYNVKYKNVKVVIENLGYGDVYYSTEDLAVVGKSNRLAFGQLVELENVDKVCFISASQPVVQILEIK